MYVGVRVRVQKNINGKLHVSLCSSRPIRFRGAGSSANQVFRGWELSQSGFQGLGVQPIGFRWTGTSTDEVSRGWDISESGFEGLGIQPIRCFRSSTRVPSGFFRPESSVNQMVSLSGSRPIRFFRNRKIGQWDGGPWFITVEMVLFSFLHLNLRLVEKGYHIEKLYWKMKVASRSFR